MLAIKKGIKKGWLFYVISKKQCFSLKFPCKRVDAWSSASTKTQIRDDSEILSLSPLVSGRETYIGSVWRASSKQKYLS